MFYTQEHLTELHRILTCGNLAGNTHVYKIIMIIIKCSPRVSRILQLHTFRLILQMFSKVITGLNNACHPVMLPHHPLMQPNNLLVNFP